MLVAFLQYRHTAGGASTWGTASKASHWDAAGCASTWGTASKASHWDAAGCASTSGAAGGAPHTQWIIIRIFHQKHR